MKRARLENKDNCHLLDLMGAKLVSFVIFPHLSGADCARLGATCRDLHKLAQLERRVRLHHVWYNHPRDMFERKILYTPIASFWAEQGVEQLMEYGYTGEGRTVCLDEISQRYILFNDFYARGFQSDYWDEFVARVKQDKEFGFQYTFIEFPTLPSIQRYTVNGPLKTTVHRGSCIWITWPAKKQ
jgi:hypothetical protein